MFDPNAPLPDFVAQQADIDLQTKYADALRKRVMGMPNLQMVGNIAVKPHWAEYLAPVLQQYQAGQADKRVAESTRNMLNQQNQAANQWRASVPQVTPAVQGYGANEMDNEAVPNRPAVPVSRDQILKYTLAGLNNPRTVNEAGIANKSLTSDLTRSEDQEFKTQERADTEAFRAGESALARKQAGELRREALAQQASASDSQLQDRVLNREQRADLAKQHNEVLLSMNAATNEARMSMRGAMGSAAADRAAAKAESDAIKADAKLASDAEKTKEKKTTQVNNEVAHLSTAAKDFATLREAAGGIQNLLDSAPLKSNGKTGDIPGLGREGLLSPFIRSEQGNVNRQLVQKYSNAMLRAQAGLSQTLSEQEKSDLEVMATGKFTQAEFERSWPSSMAKMNASLANLRARASDEAHVEYKRRGGADLSDVVSKRPSALPKSTAEQMPPGMDPARWNRMLELQKARDGK